MEPIDQNAVVGHGVSIACQAEGFPIPTVTWKQSIGKSRGRLKRRISEREETFLSALLPAATREALRLRRGARNENVHSHLISLNNV